MHGIVSRIQTKKNIDESFIGFIVASACENVPVDHGWLISSIKKCQSNCVNECNSFILWTWSAFSAF